MIRKTLIAALALAAAGPVCAQDAQTAQGADATESVEYSSDKYKVETNRFWSNWFVSVGGGAQVYFGNHDKQADFGDRLSGALDVAVGKWFTPGIGVRFMYSGLTVKGATQKGALAHSTGEDVPGKGGNGYWLEKQKFNYFNFHFDALFNLSNLLCGYNEKRVYNLSAYGGLGVMKVSEEPSATDISAHFGLLNSFRLSSALDLNLDLRGTMVNDEFDGEPGGRGGEGMFTATIGLTYKFKPRGWDRSKTVTRLVYNNDEINAMREKLNLMSEENARLKEALARGGQEREKIVAAANLVIFEIGKSKLSNLSRANLGLLAEVIKQGDHNAVYTVTGYADKGTGSKGLNERLSKKRAEAVFDCLVNEYGVNKSQLKIDYKGGVDNMFYDDPRLSRAVITRSN